MGRFRENRDCSAFAEGVTSGRELVIALAVDSFSHLLADDLVITAKGGARPSPVFAVNDANAPRFSKEAMHTKFLR